MSFSVILAALFLATFCNVGLSEHACGVEPCRTSNPYYKDCILEYANIILKCYSEKGIPDLLPIFDPFYLKELYINRVLPGLKVQANLTDVYFYGWKNNTVLKTEINEIGNGTVVFHYLQNTPRVIVDTNYRAKGTLLGLLLNSEGRIHATFTNVTTKIFAKAETYNDEKGVAKLRLTEFKAEFILGSGKVSIKTSLKYAITAKPIETFFNLFPTFVLNLTKSIYNDEATRVLGDIVRNVLAKQPKRRLFPR